MSSPADAYSLRQITDAEFDAVHTQVSRSFLSDSEPAERANDRAVAELDRTLATFDGDLPVGFAAAFSRTLTVPGAQLPIAAVTAVGVAATHRRQGILTRSMRRQLTDVHESGRESIAALWASEPGIYGRFGYGLASLRCHTTVRTLVARLRPDVDRGAGLLSLVAVEQGRPQLEQAYERQRTQRTGFLDRSRAWWDVKLSDPESARHGASSLQCLVHQDAAGDADGYALFQMKSAWGQDGPDGELAVRELVAVTPAAHAALWKQLLETDLVRRIIVHFGDADDPLVHLVGNPAGVIRSIKDGLWVRLVDVADALAARRYAHDVDVVLEVEDSFCPWNTGRWRLRGSDSGATCTATADRADLTVDIRSLGGAYLGGTLLSSFAAAGQVLEHGAGALADASTAFAGVRPPYCPEIF